MNQEIQLLVAILNLLIMLAMVRFLEMETLLSKDGAVVIGNNIQGDWSDAVQIGTNDSRKYIIDNNGDMYYGIQWNRRSCTTRGLVGIVATCLFLVEVEELIHGSLFHH
jgi:hypothetical protein